MRKSETFKIAADSIKGAVLAVLAAIGGGFATVQTTVFFGLIATGSTLSIPILGAWAAGGAVLFGALAFATQRIRKSLISREMKRMMNTP
jgi:hypothetical protein